MTLDDIQNQIALDFDSSSSALASTNSEYSRRTKLINRYERLWAERKSYAWNALLKEDEITLSANTTSVNLPAGFINNSLQLSQDGRIKIGESWYLFVRRDQADTYESNAQVCYLLGDEILGYTLNVKYSSTENRTVYCNYFTNKLAVATDATTEKALMALTTDYTKCPNPYYLVYSVLATLYKSDDEMDKGLDYERLAENEMDQMIANENMGMYQQGVTIEDISSIEGYPEIGVIR